MYRSHPPSLIDPSVEIPDRPWWLRYGVAFVVVALGYFARELLSLAIDPTSLPFIFFFPAVAVAAWYGGLGPGIASIVLSTFAAYLFLYQRPVGFGVVAAAAFIIAASFIVAAIGLMHRAKIALSRSRGLVTTTLASIGDAVIVTDAHGRVTYLNGEAERLTKWTTADAQGKLLSEVFQIVNEKTRNVAESPVEKVLRHGKTVGLANHTILIAKDGSETPIDDSAAPIWGLGPTPFGVVLVFRDVIEQRNAQRATVRLAAIVESSNDAIFTKNLDGVIQTWNASAERLFGYKADEIIGKPITTLIPPDRLDEEEDILDHLRQGKHFTRLETFRVAKDGHLIPVSLRISPLRDEGGEIIGASKILHDISDIVAAREALVHEKDLFATTLASIGDGVIMTDAEGRITFMNAVAETLTGWKSHDAEGAALPDVFKILNEHTRNTVENPVDKVLRTGVVVGLANHTLLIRKDGSELPIDDSAAPIRHRDGTLFGVVLVFRDFSEHKNAEGALRESEARLTAFLEQLPVGVGLVDREGRWLQRNRLLEYFVGQTIPSRDPKFLSRWQAWDANGKPIDPSQWPEARALRGETVTQGLDMLYTAEDGRTIWTSVSATPFTDQSGAIVGAIAVIDDISQRKQAEEEKKRLLESEQAARSEAERAGRMKDEFLATLSHELRTPLHSILGYATLMQMGTLREEEIPEAMATVERNAKLQAQLIEDLLDMNRIISGKLRLADKKVNVSKVAEAAASTVRPSAAAKEIRFETTFATDESYIRGDADRVQQIIWNLLSNAIKFTPEGGQVLFSVDRVDSHVAIKVSDSGQGIAPHFLPYVFDRFRQGDATASRRQGGLGLGLAIVKHLVELHGGAIEVQSPGEGQGATFSVMFPLLSEEAAAKLESDSRDKDFCDKIDLSGLRILVVDDERDATALAKRILEECKAQVETAFSAEEGLRKLSERKFHALVSDIGMPDVDGYQFIAGVRGMKQSENADIPALALTAFAREVDRTYAAEAGFQMHLKKPVDAEELVVKLAALVGRIP